MTEYELIALQHGASTEDTLHRPFPDIHGWSFMEECRAKYSWSIPSEEAIQAIRGYGPFLEVGSGNGYWAFEMATRGIDITPTDKSPLDPHWFKPQHAKLWYPVFKADAETAVETYDRPGLLLSWPSYAESWALNALTKFRGKYVVYIGEGYGGCTADDGFHDELSTNWEEILDLEIPQWWGLHDRLWVYTRKMPELEPDKRKVNWQ